jgi:pimeloyl-ACP methyl ester carboxylesterase
MCGPVVLLLGFLAAGEPPPEVAPRVKPEAFQAWLEASQEGTLAVPEKVAARARSYQYVFVGGFSSERMSDYFLQNATDLMARGIPQKSIHFIFPSSDGTIDENADHVRDSFRKITREATGKLVVIAHSRGACDALAFALRDPEFVAERVEALFLIQGPFGGTPLADGVVGDGPAPDRRLALRHRAVVSLLARREHRDLDQGKDGGLLDLTRDASHAFWANQLREHASAVPVVGPRTYYLTAATPAANHRLFLRAVARYLETYSDGESDGVVRLEDQSLRGIGTVLAVLPVGHTDLTHRLPSGRPQRRLRRALVDALIMAVGSGRTEENGPDRPG